VLVTKLLADAGYDCGLVGKLHLSRAEGGVEKRTDDGYRVFDWSHHPFPARGEDGRYGEWLRDKKGLDPNELYDSLSGEYGPGVPEEYHQTTWCTDAAIQFVTEKRNGQPWMLSVNPFDPHPPFLPPQKYLDHYDPRNLPFPLFQEEDVDHQRLFRDIDQGTKEAVNPYLFDGKASHRHEERGSLKVMPGSVPPTSYDARVVKAHYYACVELIDSQFGRLVHALEETNQLDNTLVIFTSDHGELLGDHGLMYKGCRFFESLVRVPLLISWPARFQGGKITSALVELVDIAPTLLESAGLDVPYYIQGRSLLPVLEDHSSHHKDYVLSEYNDATSRPGASHGSMYFDGRHKISVYHGHDVGEIYDLSEDPGESNNLWFGEDARDLKCDLLKRHFDAMMLASSAGIERTGRY
jgi:arylsulfatase A-like enzyme